MSPTWKTHYMRGTIEFATVGKEKDYDGIHVAGMARQCAIRTTPFYREATINSIAAVQSFGSTLRNRI